MLFKEVKAERTLLTLINATVSHELRNPLNSIIGQVYQMDEFFELFMNVLLTLSKSDSLTPIEIKEIFNKLESSYKGLNACGKKLKSASKFVDFFVHDILDYTMLNKDDTNFTKDIKVFDIR